MNNVTLIGNIVKEPELKFTQQGLAICNFTMAVNRFGKKNESDFIRVACFGKVAENTAKFCQKGSKVGIEGSIHVDSYKDKEDKNRTSTTVNAQMVHFLSSIAKNTKDETDGFVDLDDDDDNPFA